MNLILLKPTDFISENIVEINDFRFEHIKNVLKLKVGDCLKVGLINDKIGSGKILEINNNQARFETKLNQNPPPENSKTLFCALPRPKVFRRVLLNAVCFGVKEIHFFHSFKVEKSYWQTPFLLEKSLCEIIEEGLAQAVDTVFPRIYFHKQFKIFVEDVFRPVTEIYPCFVFHPSENSAGRTSEKSGIVIGPEGGFTDYEIELFKKNNARVTNLGERILRVEQAVCAALAEKII